MSIAQLIRNAHDELANVELLKGSDLEDQVGTVYNATCGLSKPDDADRVDKYLDVHGVNMSTQLTIASDMVKKMCLHGALWRASEGDVGAYLLMCEATTSALKDEKVGGPVHGLIFRFNDRPNTEHGDVLDILLRASKIVDEEGI